jgi:hypothetical protein
MSFHDEDDDDTDEDCVTEIRTPKVNNSLFNFIPLVSGDYEDDETVDDGVGENDRFPVKYCD